jgi:hypothetical protein
VRQWRIIERFTWWFDRSVGLALCGDTGGRHLAHAQANFMREIFRSLGLQSGRRVRLLGATLASSYAEIPSGKSRGRRSEHARWRILGRHQLCLWSGKTGWFSSRTTNSFIWPSLAAAKRLSSILRSSTGSVRQTGIRLILLFEPILPHKTIDDVIRNKPPKCGAQEETAPVSSSRWRI